MILPLLFLCCTSQTIYPTTSPAEANSVFEAKYPTVLNITNQNAKGGQILNTCSNDKQFALTYDDGPQPPTLKLLDLLKKRNIKATFFVVGSNVKDYRDILKRAHDEGHEIAIHTWSHPYLPSLTNSQIMSELLYTQMIIEETIGIKPLLMRPPYGELNNRVLDIVYALGLKPVLWTHDTQDAILGPNAVSQNVNKWVKEGITKGISLEHDINEDYVAQAGLVIDKISEFGMNFVKISECIGVSDQLKTIITAPTVSTTSTNATSTTNLGIKLAETQGPLTGSASRLLNGNLLFIIFIFLY